VFKLRKYIRGKAKTLMILAIVAVIFQAIFNVIQPMCLMIILNIVEQSENSGTGLTGDSLTLF